MVHKYIVLILYLDMNLEILQGKSSKSWGAS